MAENDVDDAQFGPPEKPRADRVRYSEPERSSIYEEYRRRAENQDTRDRVLRMEWENEQEKAEKAERKARRRGILRWIVGFFTAIATASIFASPAKWITDLWNSMFGHP
jgi:hypothetical protein